MSDLKQQLAALHDQLTILKNPDADTRQLLGVLLADISRLMHTDASDVSGTASSESSPVETMENVAARFDADHPALSGALRQLLDALGKAGI
ncbi:MAG TPA: DUF4404 family protein [Steroidobacteraceae bacterium]|jgi:hypothetical protein|nr:DUF4404 family protein [Steroidobacteraceae bacterium]